MAKRHLEQVVSAVVLASTPRVQVRVADAARDFQAVAADVSKAARAAYRALVETDGSEECFARVSPLNELTRMRLGSRPPRRTGAGSPDDLRAIPSVFP